ncbi:leucyl aminopeptidase [Patescibacteria group bacterium]|nr:MAG: leucyl aminopeptidase [Patescibacteria group bacterium]
MNITVRKGALPEEKVDVLVVGAFMHKDGFTGEAAKLDEALDGLLAAEAKDHAFKGKAGETLSVRIGDSMKAKRLVIVGLGEPEACSEESVREAAAAGFNRARNSAARRVAFVLLGEGKVSARAVGKAMAEGIRLGSYAFEHYKSEKSKLKVDEVVILTGNARDAKSAEDGVMLGEIYAAATSRARDLVNSPSAHMSPRDLLLAAQEAVKGQKGVRIRSYDKAALAKMGAGGILGVGQGSDHDPVLAHMSYKPAGAKKRVALVGKAITFDSGGLSLKSAGNMETMKLDMAGAAAVIGAFSVIAKLGVKAEVHGIFGACENMPSGKAIRPGDVVKTLNGKTIEIRNTDAEGRVTLADALAYAARLKPDLIVDIATLTGAAVVALGDDITALMTNDERAGAKVKVAAAGAGESVWELPLEKRYRDDVISDIADYKNDGPRSGGAITAGLLLKEFVNDIPWVHLDIAGPAFAEKPRNAYTRKGGTGHGVRTLLELLRNA